MLSYFWAYVAGVLTLINPCVLPLLPIIIASAMQSSIQGPIALAGGLIVSFTAVGVGASAFGHLIGIDGQVFHRAAAVLMVLFGTILLIPKSQNLLAALSAPLVDRASSRVARIRGTGLAEQFLVGALLGAVWSPCIGPTLGGAVSLAASGENLTHAALTMIVFGIGVATVLLSLAYGSRRVVTARRERLSGLMPWAKPIMGVSLLLVGVAIFFHLDRAIESWLLDLMPLWLLKLSVSV